MLISYSNKYFGALTGTAQKVCGKEAVSFFHNVNPSFIRKLLTRLHFAIKTGSCHFPGQELQAHHIVIPVTQNNMKYVHNDHSTHHPHQLCSSGSWAR